MTPPATATSRPAASDATAATGNDIAHIRSQFPALRRVHAGHPVAYFDGPGGTQVPQTVIDAVSEYLVHHNANTHWNYPTSRETDAVLATARETLADFVGGAAEEIVFGANATTLTFQVSRTLAGQVSSGDELVITELDHHANVGPWQQLARERGCSLQVVRMNPADGSLDWNDFERKVSKRTRLIAIGAASNALGTINDLQRAARIAKTVGALTYVDAVHYAPHNLVDVRALDFDFLVMSAYKFYGPHVGVLWCRRELLQSLPFPKLEPAPNTTPDRAETGTLNHEGIAGAAAAVDYLASLAKGRSRRHQLESAFAWLHRRGIALSERIWTGLSDLPHVTLYGPHPKSRRTPTIAFTVANIPTAEAARLLAEQGLFLSHGDFYAATVVERLGLAPEGLLRAGCACYTSEDEVDRLVAAVRMLATA